jgi:hypothetical protein
MRCARPVATARCPWFPHRPGTRRAQRVVRRFIVKRGLTYLGEVRRVRPGPGLRPGPCRQARWVGRGSKVNGAPKARPACGMRSTVEVGGADPDNARRSAPVAVTFPATAHPARA